MKEIKSFYVKEHRRFFTYSLIHPQNQLQLKALYIFWWFISMTSSKFALPTIPFTNNVKDLLRIDLI